VVRVPEGLRRALTFKPLFLGMVAMLLVLAFAALASEVLEGDMSGLDTYMLHTAQAWRTDHRWLVDVMRDLSGLGSLSILTLSVVLTVGYLLLISARATALLVAASGCVPARGVGPQPGEG
jgi:undecaprenyl-diphosphatase